MTETDDIALIRRAYDAWAERGVEGVLELCADDVVWVPPPYALEHGPFRSHDEIRRGVGAYFDSFEIFLPRPKQVLATPTPGLYLVLVETHTRGKGSGVEVTIEVAHLIEARDGQLAGLRVMTDIPGAFAAAGLDPPG